MVRRGASRVRRPRVGRPGDLVGDGTTARGRGRTPRAGTARRGRRRTRRTGHRRRHRVGRSGPARGCSSRTRARAREARGAMASEDHETFFHIDDRPIALLTTTSRSALPALGAHSLGARPPRMAWSPPRRRCGGTRRRCAACFAAGSRSAPSSGPRTRRGATKAEVRGRASPPPAEGFPTADELSAALPRPSAHLDRPPTSRAPPDALTDLANAALLSDRGPTHPLPERVAALPNVRLPGTRARRDVRRSHRLAD